MVTYEEYQKAVQMAKDYIGQLESESQCLEMTIGEAVKHCSPKAVSLVMLATNGEPTGIHKFFMTHPKKLMSMVHGNCRRALTELDTIAKSHNIDWK